jgi:hypothetical protein
MKEYVFFIIIQKKAGIDIKPMPANNFYYLLMAYLPILYNLPSSVTAYKAPSFPSATALKR